MTCSVLDEAAVFSDDGLYRFWLSRDVTACPRCTGRRCIVHQRARTRKACPCECHDADRFIFARPAPTKSGLVVFVGLNPSTADATRNDPTIRRCIGFANRWGYARLGVLNVFPLRSTDPAALLGWDGTDSGTNDLFFAAAIDAADLVVAAWSGYVGRVAKRVPAAIVPDVEAWCGRYATPLVCLGRTKDGSPRHPLYVRGDVQPKPYHTEVAT